MDQPTKMIENGIIEINLSPDDTDSPIVWYEAYLLDVIMMSNNVSNNAPDSSNNENAEGDKLLAKIVLAKNDEQAHQTISHTESYRNYPLSWIRLPPSSKPNHKFNGEI